MFIKWRTYQRQKNHQKGDKYFLQPILTMSIRVSKKMIKKFGKEAGHADEKIKAEWEIMKDRLPSYPIHRQLFRFPRFPSCAYVHYDEPQWIEERLHYWELIDVYFEQNRMLAELSQEEIQKISDEIESILPRPYGYLLEILNRAYEAGMPRGQSPKEYYSKNYSDETIDEESPH